MPTDLQLPGATKVIPGLHVGGIDACEPAMRLLREGAPISIVHACKDPCHRRLLGYEGRGAPKDSPEYLLAPRLHEIYLNLIDAPKMEFIPKELVETAVRWIVPEGVGRETLIHCDQGNSRAPAIALLFLATRGYFTGKHLEAAISQFRDTVYPNFEPGAGMKAFLDTYWHKYNA